MQPPLNIQASITILYVNNQALSREFYRKVLGSDPSLDVPGMTEFTLTAHHKLGLMPNSGIARIINPPMPHPDEGMGIPRCELYLYVDEPSQAYARATRAGAQPIGAVCMRNWGDQAGYLADPDGHIIAFAKKMEG